MAFLNSKEGITNLTLIRRCGYLPPLVNSGGAFDDINPFAASLPRLELYIFAVFSISHGFHFILKRFGIPIFVSQCLAGILLGSTGLAHQPQYRKFMFTLDSREVFETVSAFGFQLFFLHMGLKMDSTIVAKTGRKAFYCGILSMIIPLILGAATMLTLSNYWELNKQGQLEISLVMIVHSMTPYPVIYGLLNDLEIVNSELGRLGLSSASVSDILTLLLALLGFLRALFYLNGKEALINMAASIVFILIVVFVVRPAMIWVIKQTPEGRPVKDKYLHIIIVGAMLSGLITNFIGMHVFLGAVAIGMAVPTGPPLASALAEKLEWVVTGLLMPLFVAMCTMRADLLEINLEDNLLKSTAIVIGVVILAKFAACLVPLLFCKLPKKNAFALALIMSSKGIIELYSYTYMRERKGMTDAMFAFSVVIIILTTSIASVLVNCLYDPSRKYECYQKRNLMNSKELHILACIYRPDNITGIINFLQASSSNTKGLVAVDVLHLIKLIGRASPIFISHQMQTVSKYSYSETVVRSFNNFQKINSEIVSINVFTAISPPKFMHEDIWTLALDKLSSFMVLPFHQKWLPDGSIESEDITLRTLNCTVLEKAPCSVGILIDRGNLGTINWESSNLQTLHVAMIFLGGNDDREALVLAKRMAGQKHICLTIIRFIAYYDEGNVNWDKLFDSELLREVKPYSFKHQHVEYVEEMVRDGLETAKIIRSIVNKYNLIIVGRRKGIETPQTSGIGEFSEYPELGVLGSLLTSMENTGRYSVLVIQQQRSL